MDKKSKTISNENESRLISIVVPVYNGEKYINDCLDSILNQSYSNIEVIVVNDGSIDNTEKICEEYTKKDSRIRLYNNENHGVSYSRNFGIKKSKGEFIGFIDCDDTIDPNMYETLISLFNENVDLTICNAKLIYNRQEIKKIENPKFEYNIYSTEEIYKMILSNDYFDGYVWNKLYKKSILDKMSKQELFNEQIYICEDLLFNCNYLKYCKNISYTKNAYYMYYINPESAYNKKFNSRWLSIVKAAEDVLTIYDNNSKNNMIYAYLYYIEMHYEIIKKIKLCKEKNNKLLKQYKNNINQYYLKVLFSSKISLIKKIKLIVYKINPTLIYHIKKFLNKF